MDPLNHFLAATTKEALLYQDTPLDQHGSRVMVVLLRCIDI